MIELKESASLTSVDVKVDIAGDNKGSREKNVLIKVLSTHAVLIVSTCVYFVYRARGSPTFTKEPFQVKPNDAFGLFFLAAFLFTKRGVHLIYAINPARNVFLLAIQTIFPSLSASGIAEVEFQRDVVSAAFQLSFAYSVLTFVRLCPIGKEGSQIRKAVPFASTRANVILDRFFTALFFVSSGILFFLGLRNHTENFTQLGKNHGYKILLSILLGISEEVTWREATLRDTNNTIQAIIWGVNHLVVGEGMNSPVLYGVVSFVYAFALGASQLKSARYANHVGIEYFIMDNLIKP